MNRPHRGGWRSAGVVLLAALTLAACGGEASRPADGASVLHRGNGSEPHSLDPHVANSSWESNIISDMLMGLYTHGPEGEVVAGLVATHDVSGDGLVHTFRIRDDAVWSDGAPVTAEDFLYAWRRALEPDRQAPYAGMLFVFENAQAIHDGTAPPEALGARAVDERTLELRTQTPVPYLPTLLTHHTTYPVPRHKVEALGEDWTAPGDYVSNGPYALAEWTRYERVRLVKNARFADAGSVAIDEVVYYPTGDVSAGFAKFRAGELDVNACSQCYPIQQVGFIDDRMPGARRNETILATTYLVFNTQAEPFGDPRVRRALSLAIDREALATRILPSGEVPAYALIPPGIDNYVDAPPAMEEAGWSQERRLTEARRLLAEAGFEEGDPLGFTLTYRLTGDRKQIAVAMRDMWRQAGVLVDLEGLSPRQAYARYTAGEYEVGDAGWLADYNDPENYLFLVRSDAGALNSPRYANPDYDALLEAAAAERDMGARAALLAEAEAVLLRDLPLAPIYHSVNRNLVGPHVKGWKDNVMGVQRTRWLAIDEKARSRG